LFRILRNAWIDQTRRIKNQSTSVDIDDAPDGGLVDGTKTVEDKLMLRTVEAAMAALPTDQREVMMLICVEDLS
jgi:RNA polymerase sigma-70 factor, ECF subfamily